MPPRADPATGDVASISVAGDPIAGASAELGLALDELTGSRLEPGPPPRHVRDCARPPDSAAGRLRKDGPAGASEGYLPPHALQMRFTPSACRFTAKSSSRT
jgi:hypothetical protein